jgi:hypothetical protein
MVVFVAVKWNKGETTMKLITNTTKPKLDPVTIEFTAREALLLRALVGRIRGDIYNILRKELVDELYNTLANAHPDVFELSDDAELLQQQIKVSDALLVNDDVVNTYLNQAN